MSELYNDIQMDKSARNTEGLKFVLLLSRYINKYHHYNKPLHNGLF